MCDDYWDTADAIVVCRQLGYGTENATARSSAYFGQGSGPIHLDNVTCNGSESRLIDCSHISIHNCGHHKDAGVTCSGMLITLYLIALLQNCIIPTLHWLQSLWDLKQSGSMSLKSEETPLLKSVQH